MFGAKQRASALSGKVLYLVGKFLAAVIAASRIALGILVGEHRSEQLEHLGIGVVLRRNQLDAVLLAALFALERKGNFRIVEMEFIAE
ncbi:hypothetical protein ACVIIZ_002164 [Bradyrhizobium sp. USDA 4523]